MEMMLKGRPPAYVKPMSLLRSNGGAHLDQMECIAGNTTPCKWKHFRYTLGKQFITGTTILRPNF